MHQFYVLLLLAAVICFLSAPMPRQQRLRLILLCVGFALLTSVRLIIEIRSV